jgi:hypothetical protein
MAEVFKNPFYNLHSKVIKLEGPHKAMLINDWNDSVTNLLWTTDSTLTPRGMLNFYPHCDNALFAVQFPAAAAPNSPANIRLVPVPQQAPAIPFDSPLDMHRLYEIQNKRYERYMVAMNTIWHEVMASFDDSIYSVLKNMAGTQNIRTIDLVQINTYINGPAFANKTEQNVKYYSDKTIFPMNLDQTLQQNFESVDHAWNILKNQAPTRAPTTNALFASVKEKMATNPRLVKSLEAYMKSPGVTDLNATYNGLKDFVIADYPTCFQDRNNAHLAFLEDKDYDPMLRLLNKRSYPIGASASGSDPDENLAFAAKGQFKTISMEEYNELLTLKNKHKGNPRASPKIPKIGNLCFLHGWSPTHDSTQCKTMAADPKFSPAQKAFTKIPPGHNLMIDGSKCNVKCGPGVVPAP